MEATDVLGVVASAVFIARLTPQPVRLARSGVAEGVSPLAALNALTAAVAWLIYGLSVDDAVIWVVSLVAIVPGAWTVALLMRRTRRVEVALAAAWMATVVACGLVGVLAAALALGVVVSQGPQVWEAVRDDDLSGLAPATWWLSLLDAATWGAYGLATGDPALKGYAVVLSTSAVVVLGRIRWTRDRGTTHDVEVEAGVG